MIFGNSFHWRGLFLLSSQKKTLILWDYCEKSDCGHQPELLHCSQLLLRWPILRHWVIRLFALKAHWATKFSNLRFLSMILKVYFNCSSLMWTKHFLMCLQFRRAFASLHLLFFCGQSALMRLISFECTECTRFWLAVCPIPQAVRTRGL